jgi:hypothetical protein
MIRQGPTEILFGEDILVKAKIWKLNSLFPSNRSFPKR